MYHIIRFISSTYGNIIITACDEVSAFVGGDLENKELVYSSLANKKRIEYWNVAGNAMIQVKIPCTLLKSNTMYYNIY